MAKELPYFKFRASDWLLSRIADESYRVKGLFADCCAHYWNRDCNISVKEMDKKIGKINVKSLENLEFISIKSDKICIKFLDEQYSELSATHQARSKAGKKGGEATPKAGLSNRDIDIDKDVDVEKKKKKVKVEIEIIPPWDSDDFKEIWTIWEKYRSEKGLSKYKSIGLQGAYKKLADASNGNLAVAVKIIHQSIGNNWAGLFELKNNTNGKEKRNIIIEASKIDFSDF